MSPFKTLIRLLTFRLSREEMLNLNMKHFYLGVFGAWLVGMGRYWDDPKANLLQHLGLGSVIYIFVLAFLIWVILVPFKIEKWRYFTVVTFVGLTSLPAIFYAIPVEQFMTVQDANRTNVWFLAIVAAWRLALLYYFLRHFTRLNILNIVTVTLMPICLIISALTLLNVHRVVFNIMGGMREPTQHDGSYVVLMILTAGSLMLSIPLLISYGIGIHKRREQLKNKTS